MRVYARISHRAMMCDMAADDVLLLARVDFRSDQRMFGIKREDRFSHIYVIGKTGAGKSTLLETMALQDLAQGKGFALIDPHGDLAERIRELNSVFKLHVTQRDTTAARMRLWNWSRSTAWRHVKKVMRIADLHGSSATPKGLRHTFGVAAFNAVPPHLVQRWLGHASLRTTAIYGDVSGPEERSFAERLWRDW